jgi:hypothetical protein
VQLNRPDVTGTGRQAILILGMHRSGTSAMAGISHLLGAAAPAGMMEPAADNPMGYWESLTVTTLNESIFNAFGYAWYDSLAFDPGKIGAGSRTDLAAHCTSALTQEFGSTPLFVMKDPRFSLVFDLWLPTFAAMNVAVAPVLALRHPAEATSSMRRRDRMPLEIAAPLWLHYTLEAERLTRGRRRTVLSYDRLLRDWRGSLARITAEAGIAWPVPFDSAAAAIGEFLRPHLRHHHAAPGKAAIGRPPLCGWIAETYSALRGIEDGGGDAEHARLDQVRSEFAAWRACVPRISMAAAAGQEPLTMSNTPATTNANPAISCGRSVSFR